MASQPETDYSLHQTPPLVVEPESVLLTPAPAPVTVAAGSPDLVRTTTSSEEARSLLAPAERMENTFQIPVVATIVFVITMIAIFYLGRTVSGYYEPVMVDGTIEFVGRS